MILENALLDDETWVIDMRDMAVREADRHLQISLSRPYAELVDPLTNWQTHAAQAIASDLSDRNGLGSEMDMLDEDVRAELVQQHATIIERALFQHHEAIEREQRHVTHSREQESGMTTRQLYGVDGIDIAIVEDADESD